MYRNSYQRGMLTVFYSVGSKPLSMWDVHIQDGSVTRFLDQDIKSLVLEILGTNVSTTYITCPKDNKVLGITMPFLVMIVKNLHKYFSFEVTILDETGTRRRFRVSNFQSTTQILPLCTVMPIGLSDGWNQIQFNLAEFTNRAYKKQYVEVQKIKINANIRLRRIYFTERLVPEDELPAEYKLFFPLSTKAAKDKKATDALKKENMKPSTSGQLGQQLDEKFDKVSIHSVHSVMKHPSHESKRYSKPEVETLKETAEIVDKEKEPPEYVNNQIENQEMQYDITETDAIETAIQETTMTEADAISADTNSVESAPTETEAVERADKEIVVSDTAATEIAEKEE